MGTHTYSFIQKTKISKAEGSGKLPAITPQAPFKSVTVILWITLLSISFHCKLKFLDLNL